MEGLIFLKDLSAGQADLAMAIAKLGYHDTPLFNMIQKAVPQKTSKAIFGHEWFYEEGVEGDDTNAHAEGSAPATATHGTMGSSKNHYQIIKHTYGITGSMEGKADIEGQEELKKEGVRKQKEHRKTIEKALFSAQAPVQRDHTATTPVIGKMGGLKHWCNVQNTVDIGGDLTIQMLREMFKIGFYQSMPTTHIFVSDTQKDKLDDLFADKNRGTYGQTILQDTNYTQLDNFAYAPKVKVILSPYVAADEIIGINAGSLALVYQRLTKPYDLARNSDSIQKELISELTLRVNNPYAVTRISGLTTA
ncbi:SU10 major capsid protein [Aliarcobacter butzleri]|uniref:SU10 major capsid protein n=1 Tax=Aliarcobacter butzleri TaxID=28197 RepID=UPI00125F03E8|nr:DUF5309 family protein [Aliarcobacter butzleri]